MSDQNFNARYEQTLFAIEEAVEESGEDMDFESVNDILTLTCSDGSSIIITRQSATQQLWLAARSGGFHFDMNDSGWVCDSDGQTLSDKLSAICLEQGGVSIEFP